MTPEQKAFTYFWYEGLIGQVKLMQTLEIHGRESMEYQHMDAQVEANARLAHESLREITDPVARAGWRGWIDGRVSVKRIGDPAAENDYPSDPEPPRTEYSAAQIMFAELNRWQLEFYDDLPWCIELIRRGARKIDPSGEHYDVWMFFESLVAGINENSGNFGDGFTDADRKIINEYVQGDWRRAAALVEAGMDLPAEDRPGGDLG